MCCRNTTSPVTKRPHLLLLLFFKKSGSKQSLLQLIPFQATGFISIFNSVVSIFSSNIRIINLNLKVAR